MNDSCNAPPLANTRVLDLTRLLPGPVCTMHLADLGADVIKIEDTGAGDYANPALRCLVQRNKRALQLENTIAGLLGKRGAWASKGRATP